MILKTFQQYLYEADKHDYSLTLIYLPNSLAKEIKEWGYEMVEDEDVYEESGSFGREEEIHITVLYGLKSNSVGDVKRILESRKCFDYELGAVEKFESANYDVIYISVQSPELKKVHKTLKDNLNVKTTHPKYIPHVTISYVKKGKCDNLLGNKEFQGKKLKAKEIMFSSPNERKVPIKLDC